MAERISTTGNTGFASGGVTCKLGALCFYSSAVLVDSFVLRNPLLLLYLNVGQHAENPPHDQAHLVLQTQKPKLKNKRAKFS